MSDTKRVVVYKSKTGFTEEHARWIAEDLHCGAISLEKFNPSGLNGYDEIIFGGGIYAGRINGINFIKDNLSQLAGKRIIVFATGATPSIPEELERLKRDNIPDGADIAFFYFQSGLNYEKMHSGDRLLMGVFKIFLKTKKDKSNTEQGALNAIQNSYNYTDRKNIQPLVDYVNAISISK
jgi:flavodoxin